MVPVPVPVITEQAGRNTGTVSSQPRAEGHFCSSWGPAGTPAQEPGIQTPAGTSSLTTDWLVHRDHCCPDITHLTKSTQGLSTLILPATVMISLGLSLTSQSGLAGELVHTARALFPAPQEQAIQEA